MANFCNSCAAALEPTAKFCGACGAVVENPPANIGVKAVTASPVFSHVQGRRYPALRVIALILKVLAVLTAIGAVLSAAGVESASNSAFGIPNGMPGGIALLILLGGLCYALFLWASAEMVNVMLDIEENTRRAAG